jgi:hypothetical protein
MKIIKNKTLKIFAGFRRALYLFIASVMVFSTGSLLLNKDVEAAQLTSRSLTISTAVPDNASTDYTFGFSLATAGAVQGLKFEACTTALSTCTGPTDLDFSGGAFDSQGSWDNATSFAFDGTGANDCTAAANVLCSNRTEPTSESTGGRTITFSGINNPSTANSTFFVRMTTYSNSTYSTSVDNGTVASAVTQTLTISARVQEILNFCIGTTTVDDATTSPGGDCSAISGTTVDLGVLDSSSVAESPVGAGSEGNSTNGVAMLRTNASAGANVTYKAIQQAGTNHKGTLRVSGASCNAGDVNSDQCIDAAGTTQTTFSAGSEAYGMTIAGVNCGSTTAYTCTFTTGAYNLTRDANYDGNGGNTYGTSQGYAWDETGTADQIASSTGAVDDESLILIFAATPNIITPTGSYQAQGDFIVVATY